MFLFHISDRILSVKFDCSTKHHRPTLGINIQFVKDGKIVVRNIGMTEMKDRSTGVNLKNAIIDKFNEFHISPNNIYSFSIDNGSNVVKSVKLFREDADTNEDDFLTDDESEDDEEIESEDDNESDDPNDELDDSTILEMATLTENVENVLITTFGQTDNSEDFAVTVRCAAHSIQLSVMDSMKTTKIKLILTKCRRVVKKLRTSTMRLQLQTEDEKKPIKDSKIRWNSQFNMMFRLLELKGFCIKYENVTPELRLTDRLWEDITTLLEALKPVKILTRQVQKIQMTLSDFYGHYVKCRMMLSKNIANEFAQLIAKSMDTRQSFFSNNILLAAVYLDPRYQILLTADDKKNAQKHLLFLHKRIHRTNSTGDVSDPVPDIQESVVEADHEIEFESFLKRMEIQRNTQSRVTTHTGKSMTV